jgi:hypothetical protein
MSDTNGHNGPSEVWGFWAKKNNRDNRHFAKVTLASVARDIDLADEVVLDAVRFPL